MLRLDLSEIVRTVGMNQFIEIDEPPFVFDDVEFVSPVVGSVNVINSGQLLLVRGKFKTTIELECARCLAEVRYVIDGEIEEQYTLADVESAPQAGAVSIVVQDKENEVPEGLFDALTMDLRVLVRQSVLLAAPISVLCREDCTGLCPSCGKNRNITPCKCSEDTTNTPFAQLRDLLRQEDID